MCRGTTKQGKPCLNKTEPYCYVHRPKPERPPEPTPMEITAQHFRLRVAMNLKRIELLEDELTKRDERIDFLESKLAESQDRIKTVRTFKEEWCQATQKVGALKRQLKEKNLEIDSLRKVKAERKQVKRLQQELEEYKVYKASCELLEEALPPAYSETEKKIEHRTTT